MGRNRIYKDEKERAKANYLKNKEKQKKYLKEYYKTPKWRSIYLVMSYRQMDKKHNRGEGDLTPKWVYDNILFKSCVHCGISGWKIIGCNRLDNSKPHTMDNVEPCCKECNDKLAAIDNNFKKRSKTVYQYTLNGELVGVWESTMEIERQLGFCHSKISACCLGKGKTYKGYKWSYTPL